MTTIDELIHPAPQAQGFVARIAARPAHAGRPPAPHPSAFALPTARLRPLRRERPATAGPAGRRQVLLLALAYLLLLVLAEVLSAAARPAAPGLGPAFFGAVLLLLFLHAGLCWGRSLCFLPLLLAVAPAFRLVLFLRPAGPSPLLVGLTFGLPALLAVAVALRLPVIRWIGDVGPAVGDFWERCAAALHRRLVSFGLSLFVLPALALLLAVAAGVLVVYACSSPEVHAAPESTIDLSRWVSSWLPYGRRLAGALQPVRAGEGSNGLCIRANCPPGAGRPGGRTLAAGKVRAPALRSDARQPRLIAAVLFDPGPANLRLQWEDEVALIPLWDETAAPAGPSYEAADALVPRFAPQVPPAPAPLTETFPGCPSGGYGNPYPRGVCTWYAKSKRPDLPAFWGDYGLAINWPYAAAACGFRVDGIPAAGAVIAFPPGANGAYEGGHVGYVEAVEEEVLVISECNVSHDSAGIVAPRWWEAGYACAFRRIPWERLDPQVQYIHRWREPSP